jgi:hypothetical protein
VDPKYERERDLMEQIIELAERWLGWRALHIRPARTQHGWRTPVQGTLGKGWPDLLLVHPAKARTIAAELKGPKGQVTPEQMEVLETLLRAGWETYIWRPADWDDIVEALT